MRQYLFNTDKLKYVTGGKPDVGCILCAIRDGHPDVRSLELVRSEFAAVTVNLYPFNPGHLMIYPLRHCVSLLELTDDEASDIHRLTMQSLSILTDEFSPAGFNIGYNIGRAGGASISHIHQHIVPRYENEVGFIDVLAGSRVMVVDPADAMERLLKKFSE